jgi:arylsulfatase A-like enzyme
MRVLYLDIDSLRPDHLGCYGYPRATSPNIDRLAAEGVCFANCYASDVPCLPSRTALFAGRFGIHTGVVNHGGVASEPFNEGIDRGFRSTLGQTNWMSCLRKLGYRTTTISSFAERHSAFHWYAGFNEVINPGQSGLERADEVSPIVLDWLTRRGREDDWFLHVNLWDPHTPYRTPESFGNPFEDQPLPAWLTEEVRQRHWDGCGPHSAREVMGYGTTEVEWGYAVKWPMQPVVMDSMDQVRRMFDGYDRGVRFADEHIGRILNQLADLNVLDETVVIVSADHGENLGELNIYGDHQTADECTCHIPLVVRFPGICHPGGFDALFYNLDFAATLIELLGGQVPANWDARAAVGSFRQAEWKGRDFLVLSQGAWSCQRGVRFDRWLCVRSYHDGYHAFPDVMLFDVVDDPHEQHDVASQHPEVVKDAIAKLDAWHEQMMLTGAHGDPMKTVLAEGGPLHARGQFPAYLQRLRATGRAEWAEMLEAKHRDSR